MVQIFKKLNNSKTLQFLFFTSLSGIFFIGFAIGYLFKKPEVVKTTQNQQEQVLRKGLISYTNSLNVNELVTKGMENEEAGIGWTILSEDSVSGIQIVSIRDQMGTHIHKGEDHYTFVISGKGEYTQNGEIIKLEPGVFIITKALVPHRVKNLGNNPLLLLVFSTPKPFNEKDIEWVNVNK